MVNRIAIIGAGISGLAAGCYGQMNGYDTEIFEVDNLPGGVCTSWKRKGYTIDGCIHWLIGSSPRHTFYNLYEELGIVQKRNFWNAEEFIRIEDGDKVLVVYTDADKLEQQMKKLSPQDEKVIKEFISLLRRFKNFSPPLELVADGGVSFKSMKAIINTLPFLRSMYKYGKVSMADFASRFKDPFLKEAFLKIMEIPQMSVMSLVLTLAMMGSKNVGYPIGGSLEIAKAIEKRYLALGGKIHYNSKVTKIIVENDVALGIQLSDGAKYKSDTVISAADGRSTIFGMLDGKYVDETIEKYYSEMPIFDPLVYVSLGVDSDFSGEPTHLIFKTKSPVRIGEKSFTSVGCTNYSFDSTLAPKGKTVLISMFPTSYEYWKKTATQGQIYENEKQRISREVIAALERRFPKLSNKVEVIDVATPLTFERYTANYHGTYEGWLPTTKNYGKTLRNTLAGLKNLFNRTMDCSRRRRSNRSDNWTPSHQYSMQKRKQTLYHQ